MLLKVIPIKITLSKPEKKPIVVTVNNFPVTISAYFAGVHNSVSKVPDSRSPRRDFLCH